MSIDPLFTIHATGPDASAATAQLRALVESFVATRAAAMLVSGGV